MYHETFQMYHSTFPWYFNVALLALLTIYRPILLLPFISKIFENVIHSQLLCYFTKSNILSDFQYGFRPQHSTEHAALHFHSDLMQRLDSKKTPYF